MSEKKYTVYYSPVAKETAADQTNRIRQEIRSLNVFPERYQLVAWEPWNQIGIRQIPVDHYIVYYRVDHKAQRVEVVRIFYGGQDIESIIQSQ